MRLGSPLRFIFYCCVILLAGATSRSAYAHGGGVVQVADAPAGPYLVTIWTSPTTARAGRALHLTVAINEVLDGIPSPVLDADVSIELVPVDADASTVTAQATSSQSVNKLLYETDMTVSESGRYTVRVIVAGPAGGGMTSFLIVVEPERPLDWLVLALVVLGLFIALLLLRSRESLRTSTPRKPPRKSKDSD